MYKKVCQKMRKYSKSLKCVPNSEKVWEIVHKSKMLRTNKTRTVHGTFKILPKILYGNLCCKMLNCWAKNWKNWHQREHGNKEITSQKKFFDRDLHRSLKYQTKSYKEIILKHFLSKKTDLKTNRTYLR